MPPQPADRRSAGGDHDPANLPSAAIHRLWSQLHRSQLHRSRAAPAHRRIECAAAPRRIRTPRGRLQDGAGRLAVPTASQ